MKAFHSHEPGHLNTNSILFQIGRLLFPELINHARAMRFRMLVIAVTLGFALVATTAGLILKEQRASIGFSSHVKPARK